jgi:hypothetical protein
LKHFGSLSYASPFTFTHADRQGFLCVTRHGRVCSSEFHLVSKLHDLWASLKG